MKYINLYNTTEIMSKSCIEGWIVKVYRSNDLSRNANSSLKEIHPEGRLCCLMYPRSGRKSLKRRWNTSLHERGEYFLCKMIDLIIYLNSLSAIKTYQTFVDELLILKYLFHLCSPQTVLTIKHEFLLFLDNGRLRWVMSNECHIIRSVIIEKKK